MAVAKPESVLAPYQAAVAQGSDDLTTSFTRMLERYAMFDPVSRDAEWTMGRVEEEVVSEPTRSPHWRMR